MLLRPLLFCKKKPLAAWLGRASGSETFSRFLPHTPSSNASLLPPMQAAPGPLVCGHGGLQSKRDYGGHGLALSFPRSAARWARSNREYTTFHPWNQHSQGSRRTPRIGARASCFSLTRSEFSFRLAACCNKPGARPATVGNGAFPA